MNRDDIEDIRVKGDALLQNAEHVVSETAREAGEELLKAADSETAASSENEQKYATDHIVDKASYAVSMTASAGKSGVSRMHEIRMHRAKSDSGKMCRDKSSVEKKTGLEKHKKEKLTGKKDKDTGKGEKSEIKTKKKSGDFKSGKEIKTADFEIKTFQSGMDANVAGAAPTAATPDTGGKQKTMMKDIFRNVAQKLSGLRLPPIIIITVVVTGVLIVMLSVFFWSLYETINGMGNTARSVFLDNYEYSDDFIQGIENADNVDLSAEADSILGKANDKYNKKVQEIIDGYAGKYDILIYDEITPDWGEILKAYITIEYIRNSGEFKAASQEDFENLMWNMVNIECELYPENAPEEQETEKESVTEETGTGDETLPAEEETEEPVTLTVYADMKSVEDIAYLYGVDFDLINEIMPVTELYSAILEKSLVGLPSFVPEEETESEGE